MPLELHISQLELLKAFDLMQLRKALGIEDPLPVLLDAAPVALSEGLLHLLVDKDLVCLDAAAGVCRDVQHPAPADWNSWSPTPASCVALDRLLVVFAVWLVLISLTFVQLFVELFVVDSSHRSSF